MYKINLKKLRIDKNLTQQEIAHILQISKSQYNNYETEYVTIPIKHLNNLCNFYEVSLDFIFDFTNTKKYVSNMKEINKIKSGQRLKGFRKENNLNQSKLANFLNTTFSTISSYERGINVINTNYLFTICSKYHISADYLLGKIDEPKYYS